MGATLNRNDDTAMTEETNADKFDRVWASLSDADRLVLLGHTGPTLSFADKIRLAAAAKRHGQALRQRKAPSFRRALR